MKINMSEYFTDLDAKEKNDAVLKCMQIFQGGLDEYEYKYNEARNVKISELSTYFDEVSNFRYEHYDVMSNRYGYFLIDECYLEMNHDSRGLYIDSLTTRREFTEVMDELKEYGVDRRMVARWFKNVKFMRIAYPPHTAAEFVYYNYEPVFSTIYDSGDDRPNKDTEAIIELLDRICDITVMILNRFFTNHEAAFFEKLNDEFMYYTSSQYLEDSLSSNEYNDIHLNGSVKLMGFCENGSPLFTL